MGVASASHSSMLFSSAPLAYILLPSDPMACSHLAHSCCQSDQRSGCCRCSANKALIFNKHLPVVRC